jgi:hypothetical protein
MFSFHARSFVARHYPSSFRQQQRQRHYAIPSGRVENMDEWIQLSSDSLKRFTGKSLLDVLDDVSTISDIHSNTRYAVLSHGNQTDPIYNYFNEAALQQFEWPESEIYSLHSRYSAPDGTLRRDRDEAIQSIARREELRIIPTAVRQTKYGTQFQLVNVTLWNVYDNDGVRLGQTAWFDRNLVSEIETTTSDDFVTK